MGIVHQVAHCDKRVAESFRGRDPFVGVQAEHALQEVYKLSSVGLLGQHVRPLQVRGQVDLETQGAHQSHMRPHWGLAELKTDSGEREASTCIMSSKQLKMYFLASLDLMPISISCSEGVWKNGDHLCLPWRATPPQTEHHCSIILASLLLKQNE